MYIKYFKINTAVTFENQLDHTTAAKFATQPVITNKPQPRLTDGTMLKTFLFQNNKNVLI